MLTRVLILVAVCALASTGRAQESAADSIVRLRPSAFTMLPGPVHMALATRGCLIPQSYGERKPHNVITGSFTGGGRQEWAVVCSARDTSAVLIFSTAGELVDALDRREDAFWITRMSEGPVYTRRIDRVPLAALRKIRPDPEEPDLRVPASVDHDGITLIDDGKGSSTVYKTDGRWRQVDACC